MLLAAAAVPLLLLEATAAEKVAELTAKSEETEKADQKSLVDALVAKARARFQFFSLAHDEARDKGNTLCTAASEAEDSARRKMIDQNFKVFEVIRKN